MVAITFPGICHPQINDLSVHIKERMRLRSWEQVASKQQLPDNEHGKCLEEVKSLPPVNDSIEPEGIGNQNVLGEKQR